MRTSTLCFAVILFIPIAFGEESKPQVSPLTDWIYPNSKLREQAQSLLNGKALGDQSQFSVKAKFPEVVAYYIKKSGLEVPNQEIVGRDLPGDNVPAHFIYKKGENAETIILLHDIRSTTEVATFLIVGIPQIGSIDITITRAVKEDETYVQLARIP